MWPFVNEKPAIVLRLIMLAELIGLAVAGIIVFVL